MGLVRSSSELSPKEHQAKTKPKVIVKNIRRVLLDHTVRSTLPAQSCGTLHHCTTMSHQRDSPSGHKVFHCKVKKTQRFLLQD